MPSAVQSSQEADSYSTPSPHQDECAAATLPERFSISPELWRKLEQHIQKWITEHQWDLLGRIQETAELTQPQCDSAGSCQAKNKAGPSHLSVSTSESSKDVQKVRFQLRQDLDRNLGHILGKVPEDLPRALGSSPKKVQGVTSEESERSLMRPTDRQSRNYSPRGTDMEHIAGILKVHLDVKMGQIHKGLIPLRVRRSWLAVNGVFFTSETHMETRRPASSRARETCVSPVQKFSFSSPCALQDLDTHITKIRVRRRWGLPLKLLKAINVFKPTRAPPSPFPQFSRPSSSGGVSWA
ncbi:PREDICTED: spermatogenesis-associated protein 31A6-like, partial [Chinchilla lanigera]|uniref:spermatogenesis-associated protein 31A6-like n=1 Tax=Chinchilla lanigera TaxID=34839 RepID=UPI000696AC3F